MGLGKWMARKGAVGGTARFVANGFLFAVENGMIVDGKISSKGKLEEEIMGVAMVALNARFQGNVEHPDFHRILEFYVSGDAGLAELTIAILSVEAGYMDNTPEYKKMFREIIVEELEKGGVSAQFI